MLLLVKLAGCQWKDVRVNGKLVFISSFREALAAHLQESLHELLEKSGGKPAKPEIVILMPKDQALNPTDCLFYTVDIYLARSGTGSPKAIKDARFHAKLKKFLKRYYQKSRIMEF